jgi:two-component system chemotaxis response regulator CheY
MASVMVVDDSIAVRMRVGRALVDAGFEIVEAIDGVDALEKLSASDVQLIICDVNMPRMNGLDLIEALSKRGSMPPFLMLTTEGRMDLIQQARKLGAKAWMFKPFDVEHLVLAVRKLVG